MRAFKTLGDTIIKEDLTRQELRQWFTGFAFQQQQRPLQHGQAISDRQIKQYEEKLLNPDI